MDCTLIGIEECTCTRQTLTPQPTLAPEALLTPDTL